MDVGYKWAAGLASAALKDRNSGYIPTLDGWRAIAILLVLIDHASRSLNLPGSVRAILGIGRSGIGGLGVDIFFGISGFLICSKLLQEERVGGISLTSFYIRRAFRILPPFSSVVTSKPAIEGHLKTGQRTAIQDLRLFYPFRTRSSKLFPQSGCETYCLWPDQREGAGYISFAFIERFLGFGRGRRSEAPVLEVIDCLLS